MQIQSLKIERFGHQAHLILDGIDDRLTVIYGRQGAGKTTCIDFLRWVLYGHDDRSTGSFAAHSPRGDWSDSAAGSVNFREANGRHSIARQEDGSRYGRVAIDGDGRYARQSQHLGWLLGDVSRADFDLLFAPRFDREHGLSELLQCSLARGMDLTSHRLPSERVQDLRLRIDNYRRDLDQLPWHSGDLPGLLDRKRSIERRLDSQADETRCRRLDYDHQYEDLERRIRELEADVDRLRDTWHSRDNEVVARRRELEEAWQKSDDAKQDYLQQQRSELAELESHLSRARGMQSEIQRRYDRLEAQLRQNDLDLDRKPREIEESVCVVQSIARQLDEIQVDDANRFDDANRSRYTDVPRSAYRYRGSQLASSATVEMLRDEVGQLCHALQQERTGDRVRAMADELDHLRQCDAMMQRWVTGLSTQRDQLQRELEDAERHGVTLVIDESHDSDFPAGRSERDVYPSPLRTGRLRAVRHACDGYEPIHPERDAYLNQLTRHRDAAHTDVQAAERELSHLMARRRDLESALGRLTDRELEAARRELAEVENLIRAAEERERLQREISLAEAEIARWQETVRNSPVTEHAARILRRLTRNRFVGLRIDNTRNVSVEDGRGALIPVEHVSRGIRDQVYLSFCLSILTAHRQRGVQLPFLLHDNFVSLDSESDGTLAAVLAEFAGMGQQVLVFTRHQHVADLLRNMGAKHLELGSQPLAPPNRFEQIDHVRFRPRPDVTISSPNYRTTRTTDPEGPEYVTRPTAGRDGPSQQSPPSRSDWTAETGDGHDDEWGGVDRPFERTRSTIRARTVPPPPAHLENVTFENEVPRGGTEISHSENAKNGLENHVRTPRPAAPAHSSELQAGERRRSSGRSRRRRRRSVESRAQPNRPLRFYLNTSDPVVDAPAVGPRTAERLQQVGVHTVEDLLNSDPADLAHRLDYRRISASAIADWQQQAGLACRVPLLRGHDAQILVACGVSDPGELAAITDEALWERVEPFLNTTECKRIIRNGKMPDRREVRQWIGWAQDARSLPAS